MSSGDTSILAWTGRSNSFNSCLPAKIDVFNQLPTTHIPLALERAEMGRITTRLRSSSLHSTSILRLYDRLREPPVPSFDGQRMKLPCLNFGPLSAYRSKSEPFRAQTSVGVVKIETEEDLSRFGPLYLVHPWIDFLLDQQPVGSVADTVPEENTDERTSPSQTERQMRALQVVARLRQPFGALLLTPNRRNVTAYRRVATESLITVQVEDITPTILSKLVDSVRTLDVL